MVTAAAKEFIQKDQSIVLKRIENMEESISDIKNQMSLALEEVRETLLEMRTESKSKTRMPAILDRMAAITKELDQLKTAIPTLGNS